MTELEEFECPNCGGTVTVHRAFRQEICGACKFNNDEI